jgi:hypothetical protein
MSARMAFFAMLGNNGPSGGAQGNSGSAAMLSEGSRWALLGAPDPFASALGGLDHLDPLNTSAGGGGPPSRSPA